MHVHIYFAFYMHFIDTKLIVCVACNIDRFATIQPPHLHTTRSNVDYLVQLRTVITTVCQCNCCLCSHYCCNNFNRSCLHFINLQFYCRDFFM